MKAKTLIASAAIAMALPSGAALATANATNLGGPQGTGFYGVVDPLLERSTDFSSAGATAPADGPYLAAYDRNGDGVISQSEADAANQVRTDRRDSYSGPSWATNPPVPAP